MQRMAFGQIKISRPAAGKNLFKTRCAGRRHRCRRRRSVSARFNSPPRQTNFRRLRKHHAELCRAAGRRRTHAVGRLPEIDRRQAGCGSGEEMKSTTEILNKDVLPMAAVKLLLSLLKRERIKVRDFLYPALQEQTRS